MKDPLNITDKLRQTVLPQLLDNIPILAQAKLIDKSYNMLASLVVFKVFPYCSFLKKEISNCYLVVKTL